jgi:aminocarboxymuconate-semialdehyde decarboxylase
MPGLVDAHSHAIPPALPALPSSAGTGRWPVVERSGDQAAIFVGGRLFREIDSRCWSAQRRLDDLDAEGVDVQVVSPVPVTFCYDMSSEHAVDFARAQNDFLADLAAAGRGRIRALGTVPLQNPAAAAAELHRCRMELGFSGVEIGTHVNGRGLDDSAFDEFFATADELDSLVFVHPGALPEAARLAPLDLGFSVGMPCETALAAAQLITGGVLSARPGLKVCLAHGGGALPMILGRLDRGFDILPGMRARLSERPSVVARRLWADSLTYDAESLALTLARFGSDHVVIGTDYPFAARETPAGATIRAARAAGYCDDVTYRAVTSRNAAMLLGESCYEEVG